MAYNPIERLEQGNVHFLWEIPFNDRQRIINYVRESENKINIIKGFLPKLKKILPRFCFEIIYDTDEFVGDLFDLISGKLGVKVRYINLINDDTKIRNILNNTTWGRSFVLRNLNNILKANKNNINVILEYVFSSFENNMDFIKVLSVYHDMHIRFVFMKYLIEHHLDTLSLVYDDITKYLDGSTYQENEQLFFLPNMMSSEDISNLAFTVLHSECDKKLWYKLKEYIFANYDENQLSSLLLATYKDREINVAEFEKDADRFFATSSDYKFEIYHNYSKNISMKLLEHFKNYLKYFQKGNNNDFDMALRGIFSYGLWSELEGYVDKYLSLSKDVDFRFLMDGSTSSCYKIGDYVFKLNRFKWSYEDVICPNLYLILKNLEEHYIRDEKGMVQAGIEVQRYLSRTDIKITSEHLIWFSEQLRKLGYFVNDRLMYGPYGNNVALLDSYMDADYPNPEKLPDEFKKVPLVLIDRDRVYSIGSKFHKQIRESWS